MKLKICSKKCVIKESQHEEGEFISPIFLVPKSEDSFRMILNLKRLNKNMPYIHFKMKTIKSILTLVTPNCYMAKVDIKDAYYSVSILPEHQKYENFTLEENFINLHAFQTVFPQVHANLQNY